MPTPAIPVRLPLESDPFDDESCSEWLTGYLDMAIPLEGQPQPAFHVFCDGHREFFPISPLVREPGFDIAATWAWLLARRDVVRVLLVGNLQRPDGARAALVMEVLHEDDAVESWWAAWRGYDMTPDGVGSFNSEWEGVEGQGPPQGPFAAFWTPSLGAKPWPVLPARPPMPELQALFGELGEGDKVPATAMEMTEFAAASTMPTVLKEGFDGARVFRLRGRAFEMWLVKGDHLPSSMDDLIRYICQRGEPAEAVAACIPTLYEEEGEKLKALDIRAEMDGKLAQRVFTFKLPPGATKHVPSKTHWRELGAVREDHGWLGVDPMVNWELGVLGPVE